MRPAGLQMDPQRDEAKQSQDDGEEVMASRWTIQVSSTSSVPNSSRPVNDQGIEQGRCAERRIGETKHVGSGEQGRIDVRDIGWACPIDGEVIRPPGTATRARMTIHTVHIRMRRSRRV